MRQPNTRNTERQMTRGRLPAVMERPGEMIGSTMEVSLWPLDKIIPFARNARVIPQSAIDKVAASIREFGWRVAIVVEKEGVIICGHTRLLAARKLGLTHAPVHVAENLTPAQVRTYRS